MSLDPRILQYQSFLQEWLQAQGAWLSAPPAADEIERLGDAIQQMTRFIQAEQSRHQAVLQAAREQAVKDPLTGVWSRCGILEVFAKTYVAALRGGGWLAAALVNIDQLGLINAAHGREAGDAVIGAVAQRLEAVLRGCDYVGRYGGDEFLLLLGECDERGALIAAERIRKVISFAPIDISGGKLNATASLGVALLAKLEEPSPEKMLQLAEEALQRAKREGRNRVLMAD